MLDRTIHSQLLVNSSALLKSEGNGTRVYDDDEGTALQNAKKPGNE